MWFADWTRTPGRRLFPWELGGWNLNHSGQDPLDRPLPPQDAANANNFNSLNDLSDREQPGFRHREQINEGVTAPVEPGCPGLSDLYLIHY